MAQGFRPDRVGDQIREELSEMLARGQVHDPGIGFITLTHVKVSADLQVAQIYYTTLGDAADSRCRRSKLWPGPMPGRGLASAGARRCGRSRG